MTWVKLLLCALIIAFCALLGYFAAGKYRSRKNFFAQLDLFNERYLSELGFTRRPLDAFLAEAEYRGEFGETVEEFLKRHTVAADYTFLTADERREVKEYFSMLGRGDSLSQREFFGARQSALSEKKTVYEREAKMRGELYLKLGLLAGFALVILIL